MNGTCVCAPALPDLQLASSHNIIHMLSEAGGLAGARYHSVNEQEKMAHY